MFFVKLEVKDSFGALLQLNATDIIWLHELKSAGGGAVVCHTRGTVQVAQHPDWIMEQCQQYAPVKFCKFTVDVGKGQRVAFHVNARKVVSFLQERGEVTINTTRGDFKVMQDGATVFGQLRKALA